MTWETIEIAGKICRIAAADSPVCVLIQPTGEHEQAHLAEEAEQILQNRLAAVPVQPCSGFWKSCCRHCDLSCICRKIYRIFWAATLWRDCSACGQRTRPMLLQQWQLVPLRFGWTAGQNMPHCIVLRHRTSTLVLEPKNTKPETRCCER